MSHFVAYILQFQEIIVYKIPPGGGGGSIASLRSIKFIGDSSDSSYLGTIFSLLDFFFFTGLGQSSVQFQLPISCQEHNRFFI